MTVANPRILTVDADDTVFIFFDNEDIKKIPLAAFVGSSLKYPNELKARIAQYFYGSDAKVSPKDIEFRFTQGGEAKFDLMIEANRLNF